jgi:predicted negative regulator of RcsB-dependent stress response
MGAPFEKTMVFRCVLRTISYTESEFFTFKKMKTKIVYAIVASALLFPVTVVAKRDGQGKKHQKLIALIQKDGIEKAKKQISKMIEHKTKRIESLEKAKDALESNDKEGALNILKALHKKHTQKTRP